MKSPAIWPGSWKAGEVVLLPRHVISLFGANFVFLVIGDDLDRPELSIGLKVLWLIEDRILAAQLLINVMEGVGHVLQLKREEGLSACRLGQHLQAAIALVRVVAQVRANGIDDYAGAHVELENASGLRAV